MENGGLVSLVLGVTLDHVSRHTFAASLEVALDLSDGVEQIGELYRCVRPLELKVHDVTHLRNLRDRFHLGRQSASETERCQNRSALQRH